jgi:hypothetical protein
LSGRLLGWLSDAASWYNPQVAASPSLKNLGSGADPVGVTPRESGFDAWLPTRSFSVVLTHQHDQWYATATAFGIAGVGPTKDAACVDAEGLVRTYLMSCFESGVTFAEAQRPVTAGARSSTPSRSSLSYAKAVISRAWFWRRQHIALSPSPR